MERLNDGTYHVALEFRKPLLPLVLHPAEYPDEVRYALAGRQWVELLDRPEPEWLPDVSAQLPLMTLASGREGSMVRSNVAGAGRETTRERIDRIDPARQFEGADGAVVAPAPKSDVFSRSLRLLRRSSPLPCCSAAMPAASPHWRSTRATRTTST